MRGVAGGRSGARIRSSGAGRGRSGVSEDDKGEGQREPAVEIPAVATESQPEADGRDEGENGEQAVGADDGGRAIPDRVRRHRSPVLGSARRTRSRGSETSDERRDDERALRLAVLRVTNGATAISAAPNRLAPTAAHVRWSRALLVPGGGGDRERERSGPGGEEPRGEEQVHCPSLDEEPRRREHRPSWRRSRPRCERDARVRQRIAVESARDDRVDRPYPEHADEQSSPMSHDRYRSDGRVVTSP